MNVAPARQVAYTVIRRVFEQDAYADRALHGEAEGARLDPRDRALATRLVYGTVQRRRTLDYLINALSSRPAEALDPPARAALELGMFQLALLDGIAPHAVVNESVELVKRESGGQGAARLVNAVLRRARQDAPILLAQLDDASPEGAAVLHSVPDWLAELWFGEFGAPDARRLLAAVNEPAESAVRINSLVPAAPGPGSVPDTGPDADLEPEPPWHPAPPWPRQEDPELPEARILDGPWDVFGSAAWRAGRLMPQSRASMLVSRTLDPQPGQRVLDLCAAPGAKSTHLAALMAAQGELVAVEVHPGRAEALARTAQRMGAINVRVLTGDARQLPSDLGAFDRVLVDPPCSGLGTLQSRPDIRWRKSAGDIPALVAKQGELLGAAADHLKAEGRLVYSVCTLNHAESAGVIDTFLNRHPGWQLLSARTTLPSVEGTDGFFIAALTQA